MHHSAYLTFGIDLNRYAIPASTVREVVRAVDVTPLPAAPAVVTGIIDYRGSILPVFDVARRFQHASRSVRADHRMIVADAGARMVVLHVDVVDSLVEIHDDAIAEAPTTIASGVPIAGLARTDEGMLVIQDLARFLSEAEAQQLDAAMPNA